jgi:predicted metal-dependent hydrolase
VAPPSLRLPLPLRHRLASLILEAWHDRRAREALEALAAVCDDPHGLSGRGVPERFPADLFERDASRLSPGMVLRPHVEDFCGRARRAWSAMRGRPLGAAEPSLEEALQAGAALFDAGLYFEVHEALEPHWVRAAGPEREVLQGLIQVAVGFQHVANGNLGGARQLLGEGATKLRGRALAGLDVAEFARAVEECRRAVAGIRAGAQAPFDWTMVPGFPRAR